MDWGKISIAAVIGGIVYFLLGWLVYGIVLIDVIPMSGDPDNMNMALMVASNLIWAFLIAWLIHRIGISTWQSGAVLGGVVGFLTSFAFGLSYASMSSDTTVSSSLIDGLANAFCTGAAGAIIGWYFGRK